MSTSLRCQVLVRTQRRSIIRGRLHQLRLALFLFGTATQGKNSQRLKQVNHSAQKLCLDCAQVPNHCFGIQDCFLVKGGRAAICVGRKTGSDEYHLYRKQFRGRHKLRGDQGLSSDCCLHPSSRRKTAVHRTLGKSRAYRIALIRSWHLIFIMLHHSVAMMMRSRLAYPMASRMLHAFHAGLCQ